MSQLPNNDPPGQVKVIVSNNTTTRQIINAVVKNKPLGWSSKSYASYYNIDYANWIKADVDAMIIDRLPRTYRYDKWPKVSANSLYLRINQALKYLTDNLDPDGIYKDFRSSTKLIRKLTIGIVIEYDSFLEGQPRAEVVISDRSEPEWKRKMDEWLESEVLEPFYLAGLMLDQAQIEQVELELSGLSNVMATVTSREIKIIKI